MDQQPSHPWNEPGPVSPPETIPANASEHRLAGAILVLSVLLVNFAIWGGINGAFALTAVAIVACSTAYLLHRGSRPDWYSLSLLGFSVICLAAFAWTDLSSVKMLICLLLWVTVSLGLCLLSGQNSRDPGSAGSLLDGPRAFFCLGFGRLGPAIRGLRDGFRSSGSRRTGSLVLGLVLAVPLVAVLVSLLTSADAAFEGLLANLPEIPFGQWLFCLIYGGFLAMVFYSCTAGLAHGSLKKPAPRTRKGIPPLTLNTTLAVVCLVYVAYLVSQMAYFVGGFAGLLPEDYTVAEYARRGFFEIAWICAINLGILALSIRLLPPCSKLPAATRAAGVFLSGVTLFLICTAGAKMVLYIGSFGLTRLRVLTMVALVWLGVTMVLVCVRLFVRFPYMKVVVLCGLVLAAGVLWSDLDARVAQYNVHAYQSGTLETVDVDYLASLSCGAVPYLAELTEDPAMGAEAEDLLTLYAQDNQISDFRQWNVAAGRAEEILRQYR